MIVIASHGGGSINDAAAVVRWAQASHCEVQIEGTCASACTMLLAAGCVTPDARLMFHAPSASGRPMQEADREKWAGVMASYLPPSLARWYLAGPAHDAHPVAISGAEAVRLGARVCRH